MPGWVLGPRVYGKPVFYHIISERMRACSPRRWGKGAFMKVLIVDDNTLTRDMIKDILLEMSHQVVGEAGNFDEAVKAFKELSPELVLLDLIMPGKTGLEVLEELRLINPAAKVIMVTAVQQDEINKKLFEKGATAILHKPFSYAELEAVLKQVS